MDSQHESRLTTPETARRLGMSTFDVYGLIFEGALDGRPDHEGQVRVGEESIRRYLASRGSAAAQG